MHPWIFCKLTQFRFQRHILHLPITKTATGNHLLPDWLSRSCMLYSMDCWPMSSEFHCRKINLLTKLKKIKMNVRTMTWFQIYGRREVARLGYVMNSISKAIIRYKLNKTVQFLHECSICLILGRSYVPRDYNLWLFGSSMYATFFRLISSCFGRRNHWYFLCKLFIIPGFILNPMIYFQCMLLTILNVAFVNWGF